MLIEKQCEVNSLLESAWVGVVINSFNSIIVMYLIIINIGGF